MIDAAIDYYKGKLPREANPDSTLIVGAYGSYYFISEEYFNTYNGESEFVCYEEEFEQRAKELGWINGYQWGVEYETNGEKPDLPDDVIVEYKSKWLGWIRHDDGHDTVGKWAWENSTAFKIYDERYEPKTQSVSEIPESNNNSESVTMNNDWYEKGELPPIGAVVEVMPLWDKVVIVAHHEGKIVFFNERLNRYDYFSNPNKFRPIRTEMNKLVDEALEALKSDYATHLAISDFDLRMCAERMIEAGYRKIKPMSEDEFVEAYWEILGAYNAREMYQLGFRQLDQGE